METLQFWYRRLVAVWTLWRATPLTPFFRTTNLKLEGRNSKQTRMSNVQIDPTCAGGYSDLALCTHPHLAEALNRFTGTEVVELKQLTNFDLRLRSLVAGIGEAPSPFDCLFS